MTSVLPRGVFPPQAADAREMTIEETSHVLCSIFDSTGNADPTSGALNVFSRKTAGSKNVEDGLSIQETFLALTGGDARLINKRIAVADPRTTKASGRRSRKGGRRHHTFLKLRDPHATAWLNYQRSLCTDALTSSQAASTLGASPVTENTPLNVPLRALGMTVADFRKRVVELGRQVPCLAQHWKTTVMQSSTSTSTTAAASPQNVATASAVSQPTKRRRIHLTRWDSDVDPVRSNYIQQVFRNYLRQREGWLKWNATMVPLGRNSCPTRWSEDTRRKYARQFGLSRPEDVTRLLKRWKVAHPRWADQFTYSKNESTTK